MNRISLSITVTPITEGKPNKLSMDSMEVSQKKTELKVVLEDRDNSGNNLITNDPQELCEKLVKLIWGVQSEMIVDDSEDQG